MEQTPELTRYLGGFVTPERRGRVERVLAARTRHLTVVLEDIYQTHNASAVLRSCECFGIQDVHVIENRNAYSVHPDVDQGASKWLDLIRYNDGDGDNTRRCVEELRASGYRLLGATPHRDDCTLDDVPVDKPAAVMFGTEELGLSAGALESADLFVRVPMFGFTESFNISVCAALMLRELSRRVRAAGGAWELTPEEKEDLRLRWYRKMVRGSEQLERRFAAATATAAE